TPMLVPLPPRLAAIDPAHQPWQQKVRRVGQSNMTEHDPAVMNYIPAIMREVNSLYDVDCFYTNGWPPIGSLPDCHCALPRLHA
ncbi:MAG: hypothetical protein WCE63_15850, partial [Acidobacteriaceae bacterium]